MMTRGRKRRAGGSATLDIISELPENIIECILGRLPIRDAVRMSALSRKWRYKWSTLPQLVFDYRFFLDTAADRPLFPTFKFEKSMSIVSKILLLHSGPILKCFLQIPDFRNVAADIDQWLLYLSRNGIKELTLDNMSNSDQKLLFCNIFSCQGLTHLNLRRCGFKPPPSFEGFQNLISLELYSVTFSNTTLETIISNSPLLERLGLVSCSGIDHLIIHALNLKNIDVRENGFKSICFEHTPNLTEVSVSTFGIVEIFWCGKITNLVQLLGGLPRIQKLSLEERCLEFLAAGGVPDRLPTPANQLKILSLRFIDFNDFDLISLTLCLIRSSPNLQEIEIWFLAYQSFAVQPALNFWELQDCSEYTLEQLRIVKIKFIFGSRPELELIKILLARSPLLERVFIERNFYIGEDEESHMMRELMRYRRASPTAEIIYLEPEEE